MGFKSNYATCEATALEEYFGIIEYTFDKQNAHFMGANFRDAFDRNFGLMILRSNTGGLDFSEAMRTHNVGDSRRLRLPELASQQINLSIRPNASERSLTGAAAAAAAAAIPRRVLVMSEGGVMVRGGGGDANREGDSNEPPTADSLQTVDLVAGGAQLGERRGDRSLRFCGLYNSKSATHVLKAAVYSRARQPKITSAIKTPKPTCRRQQQTTATMPM